MPHVRYHCDICYMQYDRSSDAEACEQEHVDKGEHDIVAFLYSLHSSNVGHFVKVDEDDYERIVAYLHELWGQGAWLLDLSFNGVPIYKVGDSTPGEVCLTTEEAKALFDFLVKVAGSDIYSTTTTVLSALRKLS